MLEWLGLARSLVLYWRPGRQRGLRRLYCNLVGPGDLVFDVGAHLGDRSAAFAALGAQVVALEPQPQLLPWLRRLVGRNDRITVRGEAVGRSVGRARLSISRRTPTVSTLADTWREELAELNLGFRWVRWDRASEVSVTTLDGLIAEYGLPRFCKLDVEGYEAEALAGLSEPLDALSFEFVSGGLKIATACVRRLKKLGAYEYNVVPGEQREFTFGEWVGPDRITGWLESGAGQLSSGDVYARRVGLGGSARLDERDGRSEEREGVASD